MISFRTLKQSQITPMEKHVLRPDPYKHQSEIIETEKIRVFQTHLYLQDIALTFCLVYSLLYLVSYDMYCHYLKIVTNEVPPIHSVSYSLYIETIFRLVTNNKRSNQTRAFQSMVSKLIKILVNVFALNCMHLVNDGSIWQC